MTDLLDEIGAKLRSGQDITYNDAADLFEQTLTGKYAMVCNGLSRADILARLHAKFPDAAALSAYMRQMLAALDDLQRTGNATHGH
jgi:anthranilate phosphoribosyltransferase